MSMVSKKEIEYKGHKATVSREIIWMSCFGPDGGRIRLDSNVITCISPEMGLDSLADLVEQVYIRYFKQKIDGVN